MIILIGKRVFCGYYIIVYGLIDSPPLSLSIYVSSNVLMFCGIKRIMGHWVDELRYNIWLLLLDGSNIHHPVYIEVLFYLNLFRTCDSAIRFGCPLLRFFFFFFSMTRLIQLLKYINFLLIKKKRMIKYEYWIGQSRLYYVYCKNCSSLYDG